MAHFKAIIQYSLGVNRKALEIAVSIPEFGLVLEEKYALQQFF
jgi:hypothetical protein